MAVLDGRGDKDPRLFHLANLVVHLLNVLVVFVILQMLLRDDQASAAGALLFALHPVQVEPVAWVTGMKDVLCGLFSLIAIWQYLVYAASMPVVSERQGAKKTQRCRPSQPHVKWFHYGLAAVSFSLALLAKPAAVAVPLVKSAGRP